MSVARMRPTLLLATTKSAEEALDCIRRSVADHADEYEGQFTARHAMISISKRLRHFWSPWMHIEIRDDEPRRHVFVRFSPHPSIWTGIIFSYLALAVLMFFAAMFANLSTNCRRVPLGPGSPSPLVSLPLPFYGSRLKPVNRLAHDEMSTMESHLKQCLDGDSSIKHD